MTKYVCFINNYNNEAFIRECLESVYSQTRPFDEVLVVDDGSTDSSVQIIKEFCSKYPNLKFLEKKNEGQFSTFNAALSTITDSTQIFLLDGDDIYPRDFLANCLLLIGADSWDFSFCERQIFLDGSPLPGTSALNQDLPYFFSSTSALVRSRGCWIGNPTSCISLSSDLYKKIFPYPHYQDKSFWADNLMIYAASILGAKKIYLPSLGIGWRKHGTNDSKKLYTPEDISTRELAINRAFDWYCSKYDIPRYPGLFEFFSEYKNLGPYWQKRLDLPSKWRMLNRLLRTSLKQAFTQKA
jgi:glycosyltransferase involved in cell wall biosynthesis